MKKKSKIPTILGVIVLLAGTFLGVFYLNVTQIFRIGASPLNSPKDVRVSNISDTTATISWTTDGETADFVSWGESQNSLSRVEREDAMGSKYFVHSVNLTGLTANSTYYYKINSNGTSYDNNGIPWSLTTGSALTESLSIPISGSVITSAGAPEKRSLVYLNLGGYLMSTLTSDTGNFVFQLGAARTLDLGSYIQIDPTKTLLEVSAIGGPDGTASAQIFPQSAHPIPPLILGQVQDFRNLAPNQSNENPSVNLQLPENATPGSKFNTATVSASTKPTSVILESLSQGETITSTTPQFFGKGPPGESITISVHSEVPVTQTITIPKSGSWSWSTPQGLAPGAHTITISWRDALGITRSLTRDFVVQAGEVPAFTASQSASTATPSPTPVGSQTATPKATLTPSPIPTQTAQPVPVTGDLTPTLILSIMGIAIMAFSFLVWKSSEA